MLEPSKHVHFCGSTVRGCFCVIRSLLWKILLMKTYWCFRSRRAYYQGQWWMYATCFVSPPKPVATCIMYTHACASDSFTQMHWLYRCQWAYQQSQWWVHFSISIGRDSLVVRRLCVHIPFRIISLTKYIDAFVVSGLTNRASDGYILYFGYFATVFWAVYYGYTLLYARLLWSNSWKLAFSALIIRASGMLISNIYCVS